MPNNVFMTESRLFACALETVSGEAEVLTTLDNDLRVRTAELSTYEQEVDNESSKFLTGDHTHDEAIAGVARGAIDIGVKGCRGEANFAGGTFVDAKLPFIKLFNSAGLKETLTAPTDLAFSDGSYAFVPDQSYDVKTISASIFDKGTDGAGLEYKLAGAMSTLTVGVEGVGKPVMFNFGIQGKAGGVDEGIIGFNDDNALSTVAQPFLNTTITIEKLNRDGSTAGETPIEFCVNTFNFDTGNGIDEIQCQQDEYGIKHKVIVTRAPVLTIDPLLKSKAVFDFWTAIRDMEIYKVTITQYNRDAEPVFGLEIPRGQISTATGADDAGKRRNELNIRALRNLQGSTDAEKEQDFIMDIGLVNVGN